MSLREIATNECRWRSLERHQQQRKSTHYHKVMASMDEEDIKFTKNTMTVKSQPSREGILFQDFSFNNRRTVKSSMASIASRVKGESAYVLKAY